MKINEVTQSLPTFIATVRVVTQGATTTARTSITAENQSQARQLLTRIYGVGNVLSVIEQMSESPRFNQIQRQATKRRKRARHSHPKKKIDSVQSSSVLEAGASTRVLSPQELQVKSLSDKAAQYKQQAKQLKARQAVQKAEERLRKATIHSTY